MTTNWSMIDDNVATDVHARREYVAALRKGFIDGGHVFIFSRDD